MNKIQYGKNNEFVWFNIRLFCILVSFQGLFCVHSSSTQQVLFGLINPNLYNEIWNDIYFPFEIGGWPQKCVLVSGLAFYQLVRKKNGKSTGTGTGTGT